MADDKTDYTGSGSVVLGGKTLTIASALALWRPAKDQLEVHCFPFELTEADVETARTKGVFFVTMTRPSPDPAAWSWCPYVSVIIDLVADARELSAVTVDRLNFNAVGIEHPNHTWFVSLPNGEGFSTLTGQLEPGAKITVDGEGGIKGSGGSTLSYALVTDCVLFEA